MPEPREQLGRALDHLAELTEKFENQPVLVDSILVLVILIYCYIA